jgi:hypothetical protein
MHTRLSQDSVLKYEFNVGQLGPNIIVNMERIKGEQPPEDTAFCGKKPYQDMVKVTINFSNKKIEEAFTSVLKQAVYYNNIIVYDVIVINNSRIR